MSKTKPSQYFGSLTPKQAAEGIKAAEANASDLLNEAELLFENGHYQRSLALAILAIEESGKPSIIRQILMANDEKALRTAWRDYRSHTKKNAMWIVGKYVVAGGRKLDDFAGVVDEHNDHGLLLDSLKQLAIYSGAYGNCHWSNPKEAIGIEVSKSILTIARNLVRAKHSIAHTEDLLKLWVKHLKLSSSASLIDQKAALLSFYKEAEEKGLLPNGEYDSMKQFVLFGIKQT